MDLPRKGVKRSRKYAIATGTIVSLLVLMLMWRLRPSAASTSPKVDRTGVWIERVKRGALVRQVSVQGTLVPEHVQWLSATTAARVAHIALRAGALVQADTVVMVLENADLELAALEADRQAAAAEGALIALDVKTSAEQMLQEANVALLHADKASADQHASSADALAKDGLMGEVDRLDATAKLAGIDQRLKPEETRLKILQRGRREQLAAQRAEVTRLRDIAAFRHKQLNALTIRAGVGGVVQDVPLENGQWVAIGTLLAKVAEPDHLKADLKVAEANAKDLHQGLALQLEVPGGVAMGHIERVDPSVVGGSVRLSAVFDQALPAGARVDQSVTGYVEIEKLDDVLFVARPAGAAENTTLGLFRLEADQVHATRVTVQCGRGSARDIEVVAGLVAGDQVIVSDVSTWEASTRVQLK
ncbi:MAG: HlyD family efflux transporter periplasmic adaptor subunit [Polyangiales bacterium]